MTGSLPILPLFVDTKGRQTCMVKPGSALSGSDFHPEVKDDTVRLMSEQNRRRSVDPALSSHLSCQCVTTFEFVCFPLIHFLHKSFTGGSYEKLWQRKLLSLMALKVVNFNGLELEAFSTRRFPGSRGTGNQAKDFLGSGWNFRVQITLMPFGQIYWKNNPSTNPAIARRSQTHWQIDSSIFK